MESTYDLLGNRIRRTTSLGHEALCDYDGNGDLTRLRLPKPASELPGPDVPYFGERDCWEIEIDRDAEGNEIGRRLPGGIESVWQRDSMGRPLSQRLARHPHGIVPRTAARTDSAPVPEELRLRGVLRGLTWRKFQLAALEDARAGSCTLDHDQRGYLTAAHWPDGTIQYRAPDAAGFLYSRDSQDDREYSNGGALLRHRNQSYAYDADGQRVARQRECGEHSEYRWNSRGQLTAVFQPEGQRTAFLYDALAARGESRGNHAARNLANNRAARGIARRSGS